jgi:DivIVA domain-containing protein
MADIDQRHPEFAIAIRGYDRDQVDDYVRRLRELLAVAEDRARAADSGPEPADALVDEVAELERRKRELVTELRRLHDVLGSTLRSFRAG